MQMQRLIMMAVAVIIITKQNTTQRLLTAEKKDAPDKYAIQDGIMSAVLGNNEFNDVFVIAASASPST